MGMWLIMASILKRRLQKLHITPTPARTHRLTMRLFKMGFPMGAQSII